MPNKRENMRIANQIQRSLLRFVMGNGDIVIPNYYHGMYEMDVFRLTRAEYIYEYEIKISRSDFFVDFKKDNGRKHDKIKTGKGPNRFFFVVPTGLISIEECPKHAGLIYADVSPADEFSRASCYLRIVKPSPILTRVKQRISYRSIAVNQMSRLMSAKSIIRELKETINKKLN